VATLRYGGVVYAVPAPRMPSTDPVAATLRYWPRPPPRPAS